MKIISILIFILSLNLYSAQSGISLKDLSNKQYSIDDYIGKKVVLLNFWATWCGPCKKELPIVNKLYQKYKDKNFIVISISLDDPSEYAQVRSISSTLGLKFPILLDSNSKAADYYNPSKSAPFSILYAQNGGKVRTFLGFTSSDEAELEELIVHEINKKTDGVKKDFSWRISTLDTYTRYFEDKQNQDFSNYEFLTTRTHLATFYKEYSISSSFHTNNFLSTTKYIRETHDPLSDYRLEKISLTGFIGNINFTLGDFHTTQGKGLALSINKEDDLGLDTTLQGANLDLTYKFMSLNLFGGQVNNTNLDLDNNDLYDDKRDLITGGSLSIDLLDIITISTNYNMINFKEPPYDDNYKKPEDYKRHIMQVVGGNITYNYSSNFRLYFESDFLIDNFYEEERRRDDSYAIYSSLYFHYKKLILTQEFKKYKDFQINFKSDLANDKWTHALDSVQYNNPMTLEREGEKVKDIADDIWGMRTNIRYKLTENIKPYFNYLYSFSAFHHDRRLHHIYIGNEYYFNDLKSKIDISLSLRLEKDTIFDDATMSSDTDNYKGLEFDLTFYTTPYLSFDFKGYYHFTTRSLISENKTDNFEDAELTTTITLFKDFFISYLYNRYTFTQEVGNKHNYNAYDVKYRFLNDSYVRLFYGEIRGGLKCIGGVCKEYPAFDGFKAELLLSF